MSKEKKEPITGFSADYRESHAKEPKVEKSAAPAGGRKEKSAPPKSDDRLENDTEIDDFIPAEEPFDNEDSLTKWDDGLDEEQPQAPRHKRSGKHRYGIFAGTLVLLLALTGVGFIATTIGMKIHSALTDDSKLREYDTFLRVVVAQDPDPFDSPQDADPGFVLNASLWQDMQENSESYTDYDDAGRMIVPLGDVVDACHELFGSSCELQPNAATEETFFEYDAAANQFHVAVYSLDSTYTPYTESMKRQGDEVVLSVGYVAPSDYTRTSSTSSSVEPKPMKYMQYVLKTDPTTQKQYIYAVQDLSDASSAASSSDASAAGTVVTSEGT